MIPVIFWSALSMRSFPCRESKKRILLFFLAEDFSVAVRNGYADEFVVLVHPHMPVGSIGLHQEMTQVLRSAIQGNVIVAFEFDVDL